MTDATRVNSIIDVFDEGKEGKRKTSIGSKVSKLTFFSIHRTKIIKNKKKKKKPDSEKFDELSGSRCRKSEALDDGDNDYNNIIIKYDERTLDDYYKHRTRRVSERLRHDDCRPTVFIRVIEARRGGGCLYGRAHAHK